jgi:hypothetical protein
MLVPNVGNFYAVGYILDHTNKFENGKCLNVIERDKNME